MQFVDEVDIVVHAGRGGNGCVSFRREKYVPKGGPDGGDGGNGGHVVLAVKPGSSTLYDLRYHKKYYAGNGGHGKGKKKHGKNGEDVIIAVPVGTLVFEKDNHTFIGDLVEKDQRLVIVKGGKGGKGNAQFATPTLQAPDFAQEGKAGESLNIHLELKLLADVGLVGLPNAGKSTLLSRITAAKPKIADYPFTTLTPNLGIVSYNISTSFVVADIPGLIEGAHLGKGLGDRFLKHIDRTRIVVILLDAASEFPESDYRILMNELKSFDPSLLKKKKIIVYSKIDTIPKKSRENLPEYIDNLSCFSISSATGEGISILLNTIVEKMSEP